MKLTPIGWNNTCEEQAIPKSLDIFLISENLLSGPLIAKTWVKVGGLFDHFLILLWWQGHEQKSTAPFKFNPSWLQEEEY